jgi:hypothetical protein
MSLETGEIFVRRERIREIRDKKEKR